MKKLLLVAVSAAALIFTGCAIPASFAASVNAECGPTDHSNRMACRSAQLPEPDVTETPTETAAATPTPTTTATPTATTSETAAEAPSPTTSATATAPTAATAWDATVAPGQSIQVALNAHPTGKIGLMPGEHRLTAKLDLKPGQTLGSVDPANRAVIKGSIVVTGWQRDASSGRWFKDGLLPAPYTDSGQCEVTSGSEANLCQKREQVFMNGHLKRYGSLATLAAGGFYQDYAANRTWLFDDPTGKLVEMSKTAHAINSSATDVHIQQLVFQHFATPSQFGAVVADGSGWTISDNEFSWNHAIGLHVSHSADSKVQNNQFLSNGQLGMSVHRSDRIEVWGNQMARNNTDDYWGGDWESGGLKVTYVAGANVHDNKVHDNRGVGIWFDIDNIDARIHRNDSINNYADGIRFEISYRSVISENRISGNGIGFAHGGGRGADTSILATGGINVNSSPDVEVWGNVLVNNQNEISAQSRNRGTGGYGLWETRNLNVHHNDITLKTGAGYGEGVSGFRSCCDVDPALYYTEAKNNQFDWNTYRVGSDAERRFAWNQTYLTFADWKAEGQEANGKLVIG